MQAYDKKHLQQTHNSYFGKYVMHNNHEMLPSLTVQYTLYNIEVMYLQNRRTNLNISFLFLIVLHIVGHRL
jgi:hypothetical protein